MRLNHCLEVVISSGGYRTIYYELGKEFSTPKTFMNLFSHEERLRINLHGINDIGAGIASGSYETSGMAIVPCSMATVAALSVGLGDNALRRAGDVIMKEKRKFVIVPREAPLSTIHLENLLKLSRMEGVFILPPSPQWYFRPQSLEEVEKLIVGKIMACLGIKSDLFREWNGKIEKENNLVSLGLFAVDHLM